MTEKRKGRKGEKGVYGMIAKACNHRHRRWSSNEAGQVLVLVAVAVFVLIAFVALAADVGFLRYKKRDMQKAADAGAIGGATERIYDVANLDFGAKRDTSLNGFTHGQDGVIVTVNNPPSSGPHKDLPDNDQYVEVIIDQDQPTFFARIFGINSSKVVARAVAYSGVNQGMQAQAEGCIYTLDKSHYPSFHVQGENTLVDAECGIVVNSCAADPDCAAQIAGNSTVEADSITVAGNSCVEGAGTMVVDQYGEPIPISENHCDDWSYSDPLSYLRDGDCGAYWLNCWSFSTCDFTLDTITTDRTFQPGVYCGGIHVSGSNLNIHFEPGMYILYGGGLSLQAQTQGSAPTVTGSDVTFYNTGSGPGGKTGYGSIDINAGANSSLVATNRNEDPVGPSPFKSYPGTLFYQDLENEKNATFNGQSDTILQGAMYFPGADIKFTGGNTTNEGYAVLVGQNITFAGGAQFHITNNFSGTGGVGDPGETPPIPKVVLVE